MTTVHTPTSPADFTEWFDLSSRPLLQAALENKRPAFTPKIEWLVDELRPTGPGRYLSTRTAWHNYAQILRVPFQREQKDDGTYETFTEAAKRAGEKILDIAEGTLWYGRRQYDFSNAVSMCGGVLQLLKRRVYENDRVSLRELTPLRLYQSRGIDDQFRDERFHTHEWLWEFSLQVNPGHYERGMTPTFLPPKES